MFNVVIPPVIPNIGPTLLLINRHNGGDIPWWLAVLLTLPMVYMLLSELIEYIKKDFK
jgi:hypothetical protein